MSWRCRFQWPFSENGCGIAFWGSVPNKTLPHSIDLLGQWQLHAISMSYEKPYSQGSQGYDTVTPALVLFTTTRDPWFFFTVQGGFKFLHLLFGLPEGLRHSLAQFLEQCLATSIMLGGQRALQASLGWIFGMSTGCDRIHRDGESGWILGAPQIHGNSRTWIHLHNEILDRISWIPW